MNRGDSNTGRSKPEDVELAGKSHELGFLSGTYLALEKINFLDFLKLRSQISIKIIPMKWLLPLVLN